MQVRHLSTTDGETSPDDGFGLRLQPLAGGPARNADVGPLELVALEESAWDETTDRVLLRAHAGLKQDSRLPTVLGWGGPFAVR